MALKLGCAELGMFDGIILIVGDDVGSGAGIE